MGSILLVGVCSSTKEDDVTMAGSAAIVDDEVPVGCQCVEASLGEEDGSQTLSAKIVT